MKVLVVDDDRTLADLLAFTLRRAGFDSILAFDASAAIRIFNEVPVDLIILDINIPGRPGLKDGYDVCQAVRRTSDIPVILLTVRDEEEDIIRGLNSGADDYVVKPFSPAQLVARIQTVLRRTSSGYAHVAAPYVYGDIKFDPGRREFIREASEPVMLTRLETRLLEYLILNNGQFIPADNIIDHVWGPDKGSAEMLRQLVRRVRVKIEMKRDAKQLIKNLPGVGYGLFMS